MVVDKLLPRNKRECEVNTFSPSCSVQIEFPSPAVPLAQLRNDGSCSIVCRLDWGSSDPGLHLMSMRKQLAQHLLDNHGVHRGLNPSPPCLPRPSLVQVLLYWHDQTSLIRC